MYNNNGINPLFSYLVEVFNIQTTQTKNAQVIENDVAIFGIDEV